MAEIHLFKINESVEELKASSVAIERDLQNIIENNMEMFFGVKFLASEYVIDLGRMDSIGIDENGCPVIFEYKRSMSENIINQGLFYLNWLRKHKDSFKVLVMEKLGVQAVENIDWSMPGIICIANDFNKYDSEAIREMTSSVSLIRYKKYNDLLLFEFVNSNTNQLNRNKNQTLIHKVVSTVEQENRKDSYTSFTEWYESAPKYLKDIFDNLKEFALSLGDDVTETTLKYYLPLKKKFLQLWVYLEKKF